MQTSKLTPRDWLTPEMLLMLQTIERQGSFAGAARALDLVPSALTYRVRQLEDALDVLLLTGLRARPGPRRPDANCCTKPPVCSTTWTPWPTG